MLDIDASISMEKRRLRPEWKQEPKVKDLRNDLDECLSSHAVATSRIDEYKLILDGGPSPKTRKGKSRVKPKLARKSWEWKKPALEEPFLNTSNMFRIRGRTYDDVESAEKKNMLLNYYWEVDVDKSKLVSDSVDKFGTEGTLILKDGWYTEYEEIDTQVTRPVYASPEESLKIILEAVTRGQLDEEQAKSLMASGKLLQIGEETVTVTEEVISKNHPIYEVCDNEDIYIDPTCNGNPKDAQFIIHQYEIDKNTVMREKYEEFEDGSSRGIYKNLDLIDWDSDNAEYDEYDSEVKKSFVFSDATRKKVRVYEYWGFWDIDGSGTTTPIVASWIGDVMVRLEKNPFPHGELPFAVAPYMPIKGEVYGEPDAALLADNQESIGKMTRAAHDITATQAVGQRLVNEQLFSSPTQWEQFKLGKDAKFRADMDPRRAIYKENVEQVSPSVFQMIQLQQSEAEALTGIRPFNGGNSGGALNGSATAVRSALNAVSKRELAILRRLANAFKEAARRTIINMQVFAREEEVIRVTNDSFKTIKREDLKGEFDLIVEISTPEKDNEIAEKLNMLMQTNAASMDKALQIKIYSKIARLWQQPDLAKELEEYKPEPDPTQQELVKLQLENARLENEKLKLEMAETVKRMENIDANIVEKYSRVNENKADRLTKEAEADLRHAKAEEIRSKADLNDLKFVREQNGDKQSDAVAEKIALAELQQKAEEDKADKAHRRNIEQKAVDAAIQEDLQLTQPQQQGEIYNG